MDDIITLAHFTPAEAERITGVSTALQRDWRRRNLLPSMSGHARFDVFELARMAVLKHLADRGIGPSLAGDEADWCAAAVAHAALGWHEAWDGEADRTLTWLDHYNSPPPVDRALLEIIDNAIENGADVERPTHGSHWAAQVDYLRRRVWSHVGRPRMLPAPLFIWWADGTHVFHMSLDNAMSEMLSDDPRTSGAMIVLNLESLGSVLLNRSARAFVHVEFVPEGEGGQPPIEFGATVSLTTGEEAGSNGN